MYKRQVYGLGVSGFLGSTIEIESTVFPAKKDVYKRQVLKYPILNLTVPLGKVPIVLCAKGAQCNPLLLLMLKSESKI